MTINWTEQLEDEICETIAGSKLGMHALIESHPHWPKMTAIQKHRIKDQNFALKYARAKCAQAEMYVEEIIEISDDSIHDTMTVGSGDFEREVCNNEWVNRSRLKVDTRKWLASKLIPKLYSDILPKKLPVKLDLTKSFDALAQEIFDNCEKDIVTLDEANSALDMLKKYAELAKVTEFEKSLVELQAKLEEQQNKTVIGEVANGSGEKELDRKSNSKKQRQAQKKTGRKKGKANPRKKTQKSSKIKKPHDRKRSKTRNDSEEASQAS